MAYCGPDIIASNLLTKRNKELVLDYFKNKSVDEFFKAPELQRFKAVPLEIIRKNLTLWLATVEQTVAAPIEENDLSQIEVEVNPEYINTEYTFSTKDEALKKLFLGKDLLFHVYETYMTKFLIQNLYFSKAHWITSDEDIKLVLCKMVNSFANVITNRAPNDPFLKINDLGIQYKSSDFYNLNHEVNRILLEADFEILTSLKYGKTNSPEAVKLMAAISFANFNTVLRRYLPNVLTIQSNIPGFDINNINNKNIFSMNSSTSGGDWTKEDKIVDANSNLAKNLLYAFEQIHAYVSKNGFLSIDLDTSLNFELPMYYHVTSILSRHINTNNYQNEFNQLITALLSYNLRTTPTLKSNRFDRAYLVAHPELLALLNESTTASVLATLYYNISLTDNDPIFNASNFSKAFVETLNKKFSIAKARKQHKSSYGEGKQNIHDIIFASFLGQSPRSFHDISYDFKRGATTSESLNLRIVNKHLYKMQKAHRYLRSFTKDTRDMFMPDADGSITKESITLLINGNPVTFKLAGEGKEKKWVGLDQLRNAEKQQIYRFFYALTKYDLTQDVGLQQNIQFSMENILSVIYAMVNLSDFDPEKKARILASPDALGEVWIQFSPLDSYNISAILYGMGSSYGKIVGVLLRMTTLDKSGKPLPMYGLVNRTTTYMDHLLKLRNKQVNSFLNNNLFLENPNLYMGTSAKNLIVVNGENVNFKDLSRKDQIQVNLFFEYFQRRRNEKRKEREDKSLNEDGTVHFQPLVYADKVEQSVIKISNANDFRYKSLYSPTWVNVQASSLNKFEAGINDQLKEALFSTLHLQHKARYNKLIELFSNMVSVNKGTYSTIEQAFAAITSYLKENPAETFESLWKLKNPGEPLINNLYFEKNNKGEYILNNTLLMFFKIFDCASTIPNNQAFTNFHNLGLLEFLLILADLNIDSGAPELNVFTNIKKNKLNDEDKALLQDMRSILTPENKELLAKTLEAVKAQYTLNDTDFIYNTSGKHTLLHNNVSTLLQKLSRVYQQFYWENYLFGQNYEMSNNGPIYLHPLKGVSPDSPLLQEWIMRLGASQKRNVTMPATMTPYTYGLNGPGRIRKVCMIEEPKSPVVNPLGERLSVDSHDGGEMIALHHRILENNSMLTFNNEIHHKSLINGITVNSFGEFREACLFKYASYGVSSWKLRASQNYRNLYQFSLSLPFAFSLGNPAWNLVTDYNGKNINYSSFDINIKTDLGFKKLINLTYDGNSYYVTFEHFERDSEGNMVKRIENSTKIDIRNMYDLYSQVLGAEQTVDVDRLNNITTYNTRSFEALLFLCCNVGFQLNNNPEYRLEYIKESGLTNEELNEGQNNEIPNTLNIVQPLKYSYISNFTPPSCVKFGGTPGNKIDSFKVVPNLSDMTITRVYDMLAGVQQKSEHEGDTSPEATQMINGTSLDNFSPEYLDLNKHIANQVIKSMSQAYPDIKGIPLSKDLKNDDVFLDHMRQLSFIYKRLETQILNSAYNSGQTALLIVTSALDFANEFIKIDKEVAEKEVKVEQARKLANAFTISLSHSSVYNMFVSTIAAVNSKLGVRRKSMGAVTVQMPHEGMMSFVEVPTLETKTHADSFYVNNRDFLMLPDSDKVFNYTNYATLSPDQYRSFKLNKPEYAYLELNRFKLVWSLSEGVGEFNLGLYKHYRVTTGDGVAEEYIQTIDQLNNLKSRIYNSEVQLVELDVLSGYDWVNNAGRHLKHLDFEIVIESPTGAKRIYNIYDCFATELLFELGQAKTSKDIQLIKAKLILKNFSFIPENLSIKEVVDAKGNVTSPELGNILRNVLNEEFRLISKGERVRSQEDDLFDKLTNKTFDLTKVLNIRTFDAEMVMLHPQSHKFGVNNTKHLSDITLDSIKKDLNAQAFEVNTLDLQTKSKGKYKIPLFFMLDAGNIYLANASEVNSGLLPITNYIHEEEGTRYIKIDGKNLLEVTPDIESFLRILMTADGKQRLVVLYNDTTINDQKLWYDLEENINKTNFKNAEVVSNIEAIHPIAEQFEAVSINIFTEGEKLKAMALKKYALFQMSLRFASTRIPGQSYQSFASTRITNFIHDEAQAMLVNNYTIWLTGGDYDIDKLYSNGFFLTNSGQFMGWNPFFNENSYEHLTLSLNLPGTDNEIEQKQDDPTAIDLLAPLPELEGKTGLEILKSAMYINKRGKAQIFTQIDLTKFKTFIKFYNTLVEKGFTLNTDDEALQREVELMMLVLKSKNNKSINTLKSLQNRITLACRRNFSDIRNISSTFAPISVAAPKALKENSPKYKQSFLTHPDQPVKQVDDISNQAAGKGVVGIEAAGLKMYSAISYVVEKALYLNKSAEELKSMLFNQNLAISVNEIDGKPVIKVSNGFVGIEYRLLEDVYLALLQGLNPEITLEYVQKQLLENYKKDSVLLQISALLSAATDNGKEMILGIINSGEETLGIYLYSLMLGYTLPEVGAIMTSAPIDFILQNTKRSILLNEPAKSLIDVLDYFVTAVPISHFVPGGAKYNLVKTLNLGQNVDIDITDIETIKQKMELYKDILQKLPVEAISEDEYEMMDYDEDFSSGFVETFDAYVALEKWINVRNKVSALKSIPGNLEKVKIFMNLSYNGSLFAATTQVLSANQLVKSTDRDLINFYISFEDAIRNYLILIAHPQSTENNPLPNILESHTGNTFAHNGPVMPADFDKMATFNMHDFFTDDNYAKMMIDLFDHFKVDLNPLAVLYNAEHFKEMIRTSLKTDMLLRQNSVVYRTLLNFQEDPTKLTAYLKKGRKKTSLTYDNQGMVLSTLKKLVTERTLNMAQFNILRNIIDDVFVLETLTVLQKNLVDTHRTVQIELNDEVKTVNFSLLSGNDNSFGRKEFVEFMELNLIPQLTLGKIHARDPQDLKIYNNKFIKLLSLEDFNIRNKKGNSFIGYGIQNFKSSDSELVKLNLSALTLLLYDLEGVRYKASDNANTTSVIDLLFLYNTILHRGKEGEYTLSSFFNPNKLPNSIVNEFYKLENIVNNSTPYIPLSIEVLMLNGFDDSVSGRLDIKERKVFSSDYKYINVQNDGLTSEYKKPKKMTLEELFEQLFRRGFGDSQIKFECI